MECKHCGVSGDEVWDTKNTFTDPKCTNCDGVFTPFELYKQDKLGVFAGHWMPQRVNDIITFINENVPLHAPETNDLRNSAKFVLESRVGEYIQIENELKAAEADPTTPQTYIANQKKELAYIKDQIQNHTAVEYCCLASSMKDIYTWGHPTLPRPFRLPRACVDLYSFLKTNYPLGQYDHSAMSGVAPKITVPSTDPSTFYGSPFQINTSDVPEIKWNDVDVWVRLNAKNTLWLRDLFVRESFVVEAQRYMERLKTRCINDFPTYEQTPQYIRWGEEKEAEWITTYGDNSMYKQIYGTEMQRYAAIDIVLLVHAWLKEYATFVNDILTLKNSDEFVEHVKTFASETYSNYLVQFNQVKNFYIDHIQKIPMPSVFTGTHIRLSLWCTKYTDLYPKGTYLVVLKCAMEDFFKNPNCSYNMRVCVNKVYDALK